MSVHAFAGPTLGTLVQDAIERLQRAGIERPWNEATLLGCHAFGLSKAALLARLEQPATSGDAARFEQLVARRSAAEPVAYLLGEREFYGRSFLVDRRVLIPRPETELLVELALEALRGMTGQPLVVDVGTGSGCIAGTLALEAPDARVVAVDVSAAALTLARANLERLGLAGRARLVRGDLLTWLGRRPDVVVANLPYIPLERWEELPPDVREFEPRLALDGGPGGAVLIRELIEQAAGLDAGVVLTELDPRHADEVGSAARLAFGGRAVDVVADLAGLERALRVARAS